MTYKTLYDDIVQLGFSSIPEDADACLGAVRRSQQQLFADIRQATCCTVLPSSPIIDLSSIIPDLLCFTEARRADGTVIDRAQVCGGMLTLPEPPTGELTLLYHRTPHLVTEGVDEEAVDVPNGCEHLLALLAASYLYLDDEPERAQYYLSLYRDAMLRTKQDNRRSRTQAYTDILGW